MCLDIEWIFKLFAEVWDVLKSFVVTYHVFYCEHFVLYTRVHTHIFMYIQKVLYKVVRKYDHVKWETCQIIHQRDVVFEKKDISFGIVEVKLRYFIFNRILFSSWNNIDRYH